MKIPIHVLLCGEDFLPEWTLMYYNTSNDRWFVVSKYDMDTGLWNGVPETEFNMPAMLRPLCMSKVQKYLKVRSYFQPFTVIVPKDIVEAIRQ